MSTQTIVESDMTFGPFPAAECFYVEKSHCYKAIQEGVPMAESLLLRRQKAGSTVWVVEAKSSSPRPETQPNFDQFIVEVREKLTNAFLLASAVHLGRHPGSALPLDFQSTTLATLGFRFVLVINGHKKEWLVPLQSALSLAMKPLVKSWSLPPSSVAVLNHESALELGLIQAC